MALESYPEELRKKIRVVGIAPAAYIPNELCHSIVHYVSDRDPIPKISKNDRWKCRDTVRVVPSHPNASRFDHSFNSPTYREHIEREINIYYNIIR